MRRDPRQLSIEDDKDQDDGAGAGNEDNDDDKDVKDKYGEYDEDEDDEGDEDEEVEEEEDRDDQDDLDEEEDNNKHKCVKNGEDENNEMKTTGKPRTEEAKKAEVDKADDMDIVPQLIYPALIFANLRVARGGHQGRLDGNNRCR